MTGPSRRLAPKVACVVVAATAGALAVYFLSADADRRSSSADARSRTRASGVDLDPGAAAGKAKSRKRRHAGTKGEAASEAKDPGEGPDSDETVESERAREGRGPVGPDSSSRGNAQSPGNWSDAAPGKSKTSPLAPPKVTTGSTPTDPGTQPDSPNQAQGSGLTGEYWSFASTLEHVPDLDRTGATLARLDPVIDFPASAPWNLPWKTLETFAVCWRGYFQAPANGHYVFVVGSHDGSRLEIDNAVIVNQDQLQAYTESKGELDLTQGLHVLKLTFFIDLVDESAASTPVCRLMGSWPGQSLDVVPTSCLFPATGPHANKLPTVTGATPQGARRGQPVLLTGTNFLDTSDGNKVTFGDANVPAVVQAAAPTELTVIVPPGVDAGPIKVQVGDQFAPAIPYTVGGPFGLDGMFWRETDDVAVTTFMDPTTKRPPDDERILGPIAFAQPGAFGIAFPAVRFRAELYGRFYALAQGQHRFGLECDAGSRLFLDGQLVVDGTKSPAHTEGTATLDPGWHDVRIDYFTNVAGAKLNLLHADPGGTLAACPRALLAPPVEIDNQTKPIVASIQQPSPTHIGDMVTINGSGLALPDGRAPIVILRGTPLIVHAFTQQMITVEVSADAISGPLTVQVGPLVSDPVNLTIEPSPNLITRSAEFRKLGPQDARPVIDGHGDDAIWQTLQPLGAFLPCFDKVGQMTTPLTQAWVTYDDSQLYMLISCSEAKLSQMTVIGKRHEDPIYMGDSVDIFFSIGTSSIPHAHFIVNPNNVTWTAMVERPFDFSVTPPYDGDHSWNPTIATAAATNDTGWSVELAVPWTALGIPCPKSGETHRANIGRHRPAGPDYTCWSQTHQNFLEPQSFGTWTFR